MDGLIWADVSEWQHEIDWAAYGAAHELVCVRVHSGGRPDLYWDANRDGARASVTCCGWFHYFVRDREPIDQAIDFLTTLGPVRPGEWIMLDAEQNDLHLDGTDVARCEAWLAHVAAALPGVPLTIYSEQSSFQNPSGLAAIADKWPKIVASVVDKFDDDAPESLRPPLGQLGWQFSWHRPFPGVTDPCDADTFPGTFEQFRAALGLGHGMTMTELEDDDIQVLAEATSDAGLVPGRRVKTGNVFLLPSGVYVSGPGVEAEYVAAGLAHKARVKMSGRAIRPFL